MEKRIVESIGKEAERCREANDKLVGFAIDQVVNGDRQKKGLGLVHLLTIGSSTATYGLLSNLGKSFAFVLHFKTKKTRN